MPRSPLEEVKEFKARVVSHVRVVEVEGGGVVVP